MQARRRSDHRFEYDHAGSMRKSIFALPSKKLWKTLTLAEDVWEIVHTSGIIDERINLVKARI